MKTNAIATDLQVGDQFVIEKKRKVLTITKILELDKPEHYPFPPIGAKRLIMCRCVQYPLSVNQKVTIINRDIQP